jgi:molecular chaperone GrpE (heat shock protein)
LQVPDDSKESDTIIETAGKGYFLKDKVIRHAKVLVSTREEEGETNSNANPEGDDK